MSTYYTMADIERIGPAGCVKHMNELHETNSRLEDEIEYERKKVAFCQESLARIREMAPAHSAIVAHIDVLLAFLRRTT